jgi:hypothetical protein
MDTQKSLDNKLSYYDTLSDLVPGIAFFWALPVIGPFERAVIPLMLTGNTIADSIILLALSYVAGHVLQFLSKYSIEPIIQRWYWKGCFFSQIYLIKAFKKCFDPERQKFIDGAEQKLNFKKEDLALLSDEDVTSKPDELKKALWVSQAVYRAVDAKTLDSGSAQKAHLQNTFYSFFRNLAVTSLIITLTDFAGLVFGFAPHRGKAAFFGLLCLGLTFVFIRRAKERGEFYIRGLFWSYF